VLQTESLAAILKTAIPVKGNFFHTSIWCTFLCLLVSINKINTQNNFNTIYDKIRYIYMHSKADDMASLSLANGMETKN